MPEGDSTLVLIFDVKDYYVCRRWIKENSISMLTLSPSTMNVENIKHDIDEKLQERKQPTKSIMVVIDLSFSYIFSYKVQSEYAQTIMLAVNKACEDADLNVTVRLNHPSDVTLQHVWDMLEKFPKTVVDVTVGILAVDTPPDSVWLALPLLRSILLTEPNVRAYVTPEKVYNRPDELKNQGR